MGSTTKHTENNLATRSKTKKHRDTYTMHHACDDCWTSTKLGCLAEPVTPSPVTAEQVQAMTTTIKIGRNPKKRGCLLFNALAWPQQLQVESKVLKQFPMASHDKDAHHMDSILDSKLDANIT
jgi:hypothetical protein